jgi:hypothetical protein
MAPRRTAAAEDDFEDFTDLRGNPDPDFDTETDDLNFDDEIAAESERRSSKKRPASEKDLDDPFADDPDLKVAEEESEPSPIIDEGEEPAAEEAAPAAAQAEGEIIFDPKDVQIVVGEANALDAREAVAKRDEERFKAERDRLNADLEAAQDAGDSKKVVRLTNDLADLVANQRQNAVDLQTIAHQRADVKARANALLARAPRDAAGNPVVDQVVRAQTKAAPAQQQGSKLTPQFLQHNKWFTDPKYASKAAVLRALDRDLSAEGKLDKDTPEYFVELGKRFNRLHPGIIKTTDGRAIATGTRTRGNGSGAAPVPSGTSGVQRQPVNPKEVKLDNADLREMRRFGMDPAIPAHRRQWLFDKRQLAAKERAQA